MLCISPEVITAIALLGPENRKNAKLESLWYPYIGPTGS